MSEAESTRAIEQALRTIAAQPLKVGATGLFNALGYASKKTLELKPNGIEGSFNDLDGGTMARIVKRTRGGPYPVTVGGETKYICGCGLSNTQPFCNGTHKITREEDPNKLYWYDEQGNRFETTDSFQGIRCPQE